jgi:hypothetical protein
MYSGETKSLASQPIDNTYLNDEIEVLAPVQRQSTKDMM